MIIKEITMDEFERKYPEISTYAIDWTNVFLENGDICLNSDWTGEQYAPVSGKIYRPVYKERQDEDEDFEIIGYEEQY